MNHGSIVCRRCGALGARGEARCHRCGGPLGGVGVLIDELFLPRTNGTKLVVGLNVAQFVIGFFVFGPAALSLMGSGVVAIGSGGLASGIPGEPFRFLSAVYVHIGLLHIGLNMFGILQLGREVENALGTARYLVLYTLTGIFGFVASAYWSAGAPYMTAGASGAWFGLLGLKGAYLLASRHPAAKNELLSWAGYAIASAILLPVNNAAHAGGFIAGLALGFALYKEKRPARLESPFRIVALACLALTIAALVLAWTSPVVTAMRAVGAE